MVFTDEDLERAGGEEDGETGGEDAANNGQWSRLSQEDLDRILEDMKVDDEHTLDMSKACTSISTLVE